MRRILVVALLLVGTSSCMGVRRDPPYGQASGPAISNRATPGLQATWRGPTGNAPDDGTDPPTNAQLAQLSEAARLAAANTTPPMDTTSLFPRPPGTPKNTTPYAPPLDANASLSAYATGQSSGYGNPQPTSTATPKPLPALVPDPGLDHKPSPLPPPSAVSQAPTGAENAPGVQQVLYTEPSPGADSHFADKSTPTTLPTPLPAAPPVQALTAPPVPAAPPVQALTAPPVPQPVNLLASQMPAAESDASSAAATPIMRVVNSKRITLHFELKDAAGSGVTGVDLFVTRDMRNWRKTDAAHPTPNSHVIEVKDEGLYGFLMVARTSSLPAAMPKPTDLPQVLVNVDTTKPVVQLSGVELSLTARTPALVIRWSAMDRNFNKRPITISYAEAPEGPWVPLAANIENTGRHEIPLTMNIPHRMLLRIEAVDVAGNVGLAQTKEPIRLELPWSTAQTMPDKQTVLPPTPEAPRPAPSVQVTTVQGD